MSDSVKIRFAKKEDCQEIHRLIVELAEYEKMPEGPKIGAKVLEEDGFGANPYFQCLVAEDTDTPDVLIGYCLFFYTYSTWEGRSLYMEDLYVTPKYRGKGTGQGMWKSAVKVALEKNCTRYNFAVLDWNKPSIEFYKAKGAVDLTEKEGWLTFRMEDEAMKKFTQDYKLMF